MLLSRLVELCSVGVGSGLGSGLDAEGIEREMEGEWEHWGREGKKLIEIGRACLQRSFPRTQRRRPRSH